MWYNMTERHFQFRFVQQSWRRRAPNYVIRAPLALFGVASASRGLLLLLLLLLYASIEVHVIYLRHSQKLLFKKMSNILIS
jgi:hypothetical protein